MGRGSSQASGQCSLFGGVISRGSTVWYFKNIVDSNKPQTGTDQLPGVVYLG